MQKYKINNIMMERKSSFVEILKNSDLKVEPNPLLSKCPSLQASTFLHRDTEQPQVTSKLKDRGCLFTHSRIHQLETKTEEITFQLKLKLISIVKRLHIDHRSFMEMKEQSIDTIIETVIRKVKNYVKDNQIKYKQLNQQIKQKQIQIYQWQSKCAHLEEQITIEQNKLYKYKERNGEEMNQVQENHEEKVKLIEKIQQQLYEEKLTLHQQSQYITKLKAEYQGEIFQRTNEIETLSTQNIELRSKIQNYWNEFEDEKKRLSMLIKDLEKEIKKKQAQIQQLIVDEKQNANKARDSLLIFQRKQQEAEEERKQEVRARQEERDIFEKMYHEEVKLGRSMKEQILRMREERLKYLSHREKFVQIQERMAKLQTQLNIKTIDNNKLLREKMVLENTISELCVKRRQCEKCVSHQQNLHRVIKEWKYYMEKTVQAYEKEINQLKLFIIDKKVEKRQDG